MKNIKNILAEADSSMENILKCTVYLTVRVATCRIWMIFQKWMEYMRVISRKTHQQGSASQWRNYRLREKYKLMLLRQSMLQVSYDIKVSSLWRPSSWWYRICQPQSAFAVSTGISSIVLFHGGVRLGCLSTALCSALCQEMGLQAIWQSCQNCPRLGFSFFLDLFGRGNKGREWLLLSLQKWGQSDIYIGEQLPPSRRPAFFLGL